MCLDATKRSTNGLLATMKRNGGKMTFYKLVKVQPGTVAVASPYMYGNVYVAGWNKSTAKDGLCKFDNPWCSPGADSINRGFHVFAYKTSVKKAIKNFPKNEINPGEVVTFIKVIGYKKHLIASGTWTYRSVRKQRSVVFSRLFVPKSEIDRVKKLLKK